MMHFEISGLLLKTGKQRSLKNMQTRYLNLECLHKSFWSLIKDKTYCHTLLNIYIIVPGYFYNHFLNGFHRGGKKLKNMTTLREEKKKLQITLQINLDVHY